MKKTNKRGTKFERFARKLLIFTFAIFVLGVVSLNSYESSLNIDCENLQTKISSVQSDIDGLTMQKQELASFARVSSIATSKGLKYQQSSITAAAVGVQRD